MMDFFTPAIPAENVLSPALRVRMVDGDGLEPGLRGGRDYVLLKPVQVYVGEGIYLVDIGCGEALYRVQNMLGGQVRIKLDNPIYGDEGHIWTREMFEESVLGFVVADIRVRDERFLREAHI